LPYYVARVTITVIGVTSPQNGAVTSRTTRFGNGYEVLSKYRNIHACFSIVRGRKIERSRNGCSEATNSTTTIRAGTTGPLAHYQ